MLPGKSIEEFEKIAELMQSNCFEKLEDERLKANYEIRSLVVIELEKTSFLCFGDKSGMLYVYQRETKKEILKKNLNGVVDFLSFKVFSETDALLFAVIRYKGVSLFRITITGSGFVTINEEKIYENQEYICFFYPHIVIKSDNSIARSELWIGLSDGRFVIYDDKELNNNTWACKSHVEFPYAFRCYTIERDPSTGKCNYFIGNSRGDIFCFEDINLEELEFPDSQRNLENEKIVTFNGAYFEKMIPLSKYRKGLVGENLFYKNYSGCLTITGNKIICFYFERGKGKTDIHTSVKFFTDQLIDLKCLPFENFCWTVVSDDKKRLHFIKNVTDIEPKGEELEVIFDGEYKFIEFEDRIFNSCILPVICDQKPPNNIKYKGYLGMGNHSVVPLNIYDYEGKWKEAYDLFCSIAAEYKGLETGEKITDELILCVIEEILNYFRLKTSITAVKLLLLNIMCRITGMFCKLTLSPTFERVFYKILEGEKTELILKIRDFLSRLEKPRPGFENAINEMHKHIRKFNLDGGSYSEKYVNLRGLSDYNEKAGNLIDSIVYRGILYDRQYDPVVHIPLNREADGEITRIVPFKPYKNEKFFISTSSGKLFLTDLKSPDKKSPVLEYEKTNKNPNTFLKINNLYLGKTMAVIFPTDPVVVIQNLSTLESTSNLIKTNDQDKCCLPLGNVESSGLSVCQMPWHEEKDDECYIGDNQGDIFYLNPIVPCIQKVTDCSSNSAAIFDLRSFIASDRFFISAASKDGKIRVYECFKKNPTKIVFIKDIPVDTNAVSRLFVLYREDGILMKYPLMIAGTDSGKCFGIRLDIGPSQKPGDFKSIYEWCYVCEKAVKGIHPFSLGSGWNYIMISSMDSHLHILEWDGICANTIQMTSPLYQVYVDCTSNETIENSEYPYRDAYATTMDNKLLKIRFIIRKKLMAEINECFSGKRPGYEIFKKEEQEVLLLKFKTIDIKEPHFRTRYYLKSDAYNSPDQLLYEIEQILDRGDTEKDSEALVVMINHLFADFFTEILAKKELYKKLKILFIRTRDQWGYPGLKANTRAQLYWIRSMIKGCYKSKNKSPIENLNDWFSTSAMVAEESNILETTSRGLLQHFITHSVPFIRVKTLQYFWRFVFNPRKKENASENTPLGQELLKALTQSVFNVLKMYQLEAGEGSPSWFEMESIRFFTWLVLNYKYTRFCPARLCYEVWQNNIPSIFLFRISEAIRISTEKNEKKSEIAEMLQAAGKLMDELKHETPKVTDILPKLVRFCMNCENHPAPCVDCSDKGNHEREFTQFFQSIETLLALSTIDDFKNTFNLNEIKILTGEFFKGMKIINYFIELRKDIYQYYQESYQDIFALNSLNYTTFHKIRKSLVDIRNIIDVTRPTSSWLEIALYGLVWGQWNDMLKNELDNEIILDFAKAIQNYEDNQLIYNEPLNMELIFKNIFTRLNMMAECDTSFLFYVEKKNEHIVILHNDGEKEYGLYSGNSRLNNVPPDWLQLDTFYALEENDIKSRYQNDNCTHMLIKDPRTNPQKTAALYLFFWNKKNTIGLTRLQSREILGEFLTTVALLHVAMEEQREQKEEFFRIVSHELNQIIGGLRSWISNLVAGYLENDPKMRHEYYERFQSALLSASHVIRSLLSFRDSSVLELKACKLDKEIENIVKNARVQYKDYGNIQLDFTKEKPEDYEIITDPILVGTAVMNLLTNARKYNRDNNPVKLNIKIDSNRIMIEVKDEGIGIPPEDYPNVFEPFNRGTYAKEFNIDGLGVGLAISKKNIERLGGTIEFDSKVNVGTTFTISLNKKRFEKPHLLVTRVEVKKAPDFNKIKEIETRKKILKKIDYDSNKNMLILRGVLTDEEFEELKMCYQEDSKIPVPDIEALEKLHKNSLTKLNQLDTQK